jgi:hypothetical protein
MILFYLGGLWVLGLIASLVIDSRKESPTKKSPTSWIGVSGVILLIAMITLVCLHTTAIPESKYTLQEDTKMTLQNAQLQVLPQTTETNTFRLAIQTPNGFQYLNQAVNSITFEGDNIVLEKIVKRLNWSMFNIIDYSVTYNLVLPIRTVKPW